MFSVSGGERDSAKRGKVHHFPTLRHPGHVELQLGEVIPEACPKPARRPKLQILGHAAHIRGGGVN